MLAAGPGALLSGAQNSTSRVETRPSAEHKGYRGRFAAESLSSKSKVRSVCYRRRQGRSSASPHFLFFFGESPDSEGGSEPKVAQEEAAAQHGFDAFHR